MTLSEWKSFSITKEIMLELKRRQNFLKEELAMQAGKDPLEDRWRAGVIAAYQDILDIELEDEESHN